MAVDRGELARGTLFDRDARVVASVAQHGVLLDGPGREIGRAHV